MRGTGLRSAVTLALLFAGLFLFPAGLAAWKLRARIRELLPPKRPPDYGVLGRVVQTREKGGWLW